MVPMVPGRKKMSYLKLDVREMEVESTKRNVEEAWQGQMKEGQDPMINWELGWRDVRLVIKFFRKERDLMATQKDRPEDRLFDLRSNLEMHPDQVHIRQLLELKNEVRKKEREWAVFWRIRCKSMWMTIDDAPIAYFFRLIKAKRIKEAIKTLIILGKGVVHDKDTIIQEILCQSRLFTKDL